MDWLNDLPYVTGIDRIVAEMAKRLMEGPVVFKSPFWDMDVIIRDLNDYRGWLRTADKISNDRDAERKGLGIWETEGKFMPLDSVTTS